MGRFAVMRVLAIALLWMTACSREEPHRPILDGTPPGAANARESSEVAPGPLDADAGTTSGALPRGTGRDLDAAVLDAKAIAAELAQRCKAALPMNAGTVIFVGELAKAVDCERGVMNEALDRVLVPMEKGDPVRFKGLMKEQADYNRQTALACGVAERLAGSGDHPAPARRTELECAERAILERTLYARALAAGDVAGLWARVDALRLQSADAEHALTRLRKRAKTRGRDAGAPVAPEGGTSVEPVGTDDLDAVAAGAHALARATCADWPELAAAAPLAPCTAELARYYLMPGRFDLQE